MAWAAKRVGTKISARTGDRVPIRQRQTAHQRGYSRRWRLARRCWLSANPYCVLCERHGRVIAATVVDHIEPHRGNETLFWNPRNWQSLCKRCHDAKTREGK
jgi:5-methylcytosine-specific restriction enzyme A